MNEKSGKPHHFQSADDTDKKSLLQSVLANFPGVIYRYEVIKQKHFQTTWLSKGLEKLLEESPEFYHGKPTDELWKRICPTDFARVVKTYYDAVEHAKPYVLTYKIIRQDGVARIVEDRGCPVLGQDGKIIYLDGTIYDITARVEAEEKLSYAAEHDAVTNLPSRALFIDRLHQSIMQAKRRQGIVSILAVDLDQFKRINDSLGYDIGDALIHEVAKRLRDTLYETDTVMRVSGDNFMILLPRITKPKQTEAVANKVMTALKAPFNLGGHEIHMNCSIGISAYPFDGETPAELMQHADSVTHQAKREGGNRYLFYSQNEDKHSLSRLILENHLRTAIKENQFRLHYQPQVDLKTARITGVEALIRWEHPELGTVSPMEFIPIAEETGLILPIGEWVLRTACFQKKEWERKGIFHLRVAVNLSAHQFHNPMIVEVIDRILKETELDPESLELELTESTIMKYNEETKKTLSRLKDMGVKFSIDDFGTGYSSLISLKQFPINTIKIDRSFIRDITEDPDDRAITQAIISMAHDLNLDVIAEGVETESQLQFLKERQCDKMQGFLFSRPLPEDRLQLLFSHYPKIP